MSEWISVKDRKPPGNVPVLVWSSEHGFMAATYNFYPAWIPFDEEKYQSIEKEIVDSLRFINKMHRGEPARESWACACEDSYWDIDEFSHWREMPEAPV